MKSTIQLLLCAGALAALALVGVQLMPEGSSETIPGGRGGPGPLLVLVEQQRRADELGDRLADAVRRWEVTEAAVKEVIAGRLTLREAAACFRTLTRENPDFQRENFRRTYAGASDAERHCRQVIAAVHLA